MNEILSLQEAARRTGQPVIRLGRWCATGKLRCERDAEGWKIAAAEVPNVALVAREHASAVEEQRVTALAVPAPAAPPELAYLVAQRLGLGEGSVSLTPLVLDGVEYVVAVWPGAAGGDGGPLLADLAANLGAELLDGEIKKDLVSE